MSEPSLAEDVIEEATISPAKPLADPTAVVTPDMSRLLAPASSRDSNQQVPDESPDEPAKESTKITHEEIMSQLPPSTTQAEEEARLLALEDQKLKAEEEARMQAEQEPLRQQEEEIAKQQAEEEARVQADQESEWLQSEELTRNMAEEEARMQAEQEPARWEAEAQARGRAEEDARLQAERAGTELVNPGEEISTSRKEIEDQHEGNFVNAIIPFEIENTERQEDITTTSCTVNEETENTENQPKLNVVLDDGTNEKVDEDVDSPKILEQIVTSSPSDKIVAEISEEKIGENIPPLDELSSDPKEKSDIQVSQIIDEPVHHIKGEHSHGLHEKVHDKSGDEQEPSILIVDTSSEKVVQTVEKPVEVQASVLFSNTTTEIPKGQSIEKNSCSDELPSSSKVEKNNFGGQNKAELVQLEMETRNNWKHSNFIQKSDDDQDPNIVESANSRETFELVASELLLQDKNPVFSDEIVTEMPDKEIKGCLPHSDELPSSSQALTVKSVEICQAKAELSQPPLNTTEHDSEHSNGQEKKVLVEEPQQALTSEMVPISFCGVSLCEPRSSPVSFASAFCGSEVDVTNNGGMSFAQAFGGFTKESSIPTTCSPKIDDKMVETPLSTGTQSSRDDATSDTSLTAFGAAKTKRVSNLVSKYMDNVTKEPLPGDSIKVESSSRSLSFSPTPSPVTPRPTVDLQDLPKIEDIRAKFEGSAKSSQSNTFEFGEAFRQKQRFSILADKEKKKEAQMKMHGYDELMLAKANGATGEVDTSSIEKTFSFQTSIDDVALHDGTCKIDYQNDTYQGMVFVVHRTRGMLVFNHYDPSGEHSAGSSTGATRIPGGTVSAEEFMEAAKQTGYAKLQLQLAAREGAARQLFETTGIDVRHKLDRLTPAVLQMNPTVDSKGTQYLKNEHENRLYYFLQISDEDFVSEETEASKLTTPNGEVNSPLKLKLAGGFADFTFIKDPLVAAEELKENGDPSVTSALSMVMNQSMGPTGNAAKATSYEDQSGTRSAVVPKDEDQWTGGITVVQAIQDTNEAADIINRFDGEADFLPKGSTDSGEVGVDCCCGGFW